MISTGKQWIGQLRKRWMIFAAGKVILLSLALALLITVFAVHFFQWGLTIFLLSFLVLFFLLSLNSRYWDISEREISRYIDLQLPQAEESSSLLLKPADSLSFLEQLQAEKINAVLIAQKQPVAPVKQLTLPLIYLVIAILVSMLLIRIPVNSLSLSKPDLAVQHKPVIKENIPVQISSFKVTIHPPAYTGKESRSQAQFTLLAESGARVEWQLNTSQPLKNISLIFNDHQVVKFNPANKEGTSWSLSRQFFKPGFYQLLIAGKKSDFYQVEIIPDQPVTIRIIRPEQHSTIDIGRPQQVNVGIFMQDDYGIAEAYIAATMASGKGEAVSFKEKKLSFSAPLKDKKKVSINKLINLAELGMKPGDELYFYVNATDNQGQVSRSDMYFVSIQDTTELMSLTGIDNGVNLVPEYFRSERQIIIDTEKLLKEKAGISETGFKTRSNDLGVDQKMLRLRYGKFLGEESEASIGGDGAHGDEPGHADEHDHGAEQGHKEEPAPVGNVQSIMDQYAHKHDNAEDATFFEPQLKAQLKSVLTEMWNAELRLRTYKPADALPYEYKALRLLKDLQQKSRAYVAKTTFKTSTLKPEKRLTGELTDISDGLSTGTLEVRGDLHPALEKTIDILENRRQNHAVSPQQLRVLTQTAHILTDKASSAPGVYLPALKALRKVIAAGQSGKVSSADIAQAEKGISNLLGQTQASPDPSTNTGSSPLTRSYFNHLKRSMP